MNQTIIASLLNITPPCICIHTQTPIVTVFIYIVCRFWVCIGTGLILTGRTNSSPERVFELIASTPSKLKFKLFRLHLQVVNCADFIQLYQINYVYWEQIAIIYSKPQLFGAIYTIASQLYQFHA